MSRYINSVPQLLDGNGDPIVGAKKFFFNQGTTTKKTVYSDSALTVAASNPVISDSNGRFPDTFLSGLYKEEQQDNSGTATGYDGVTLWTRDPVGEISSGPMDSWDSSIYYAIKSIVLGSDNNYYQSLSNLNLGNDPVLSLGNWEKLNMIPFWESGKTYSKDDVVFGSNGILYRSRLSVNLSKNPASDTTYWRSNEKEAKGADIASAAALTLGDDGVFFDVTGTTTITSIGSKGVGTKATLQFDGALTLTYNATSLILQGNANIVTEAGDIAEFYEYSTGNWVCTNYVKANSPVLDIYQGVWTPTLHDTTKSDSEGQTYGFQNGKYTKIGERVFFNFMLSMSSLGTLTTTDIASIGGLPFAPSGGYGMSGSCIMTRAAGLAITANSNVTAWTQSTFKELYLQLWDATTGTTDMLISEVTASGLFVAHGSYITSE